MNRLRPIVTTEKVCMYLQLLHARAVLAALRFFLALTTASRESFREVVSSATACLSRLAMKTDTRMFRR